LKGNSGAKGLKYSSQTPSNLSPSKASEYSDVLCYEENR